MKEVALSLCVRAFILPFRTHKILAVCHPVFVL